MFLVFVEASGTQQRTLLNMERRGILTIPNYANRLPWKFGSQYWRNYNLVPRLQCSQMDP